MLRITVAEGPANASMKLEGRLVGPWIEELERSWQALAPALENKPVVVDLDAVTYIDERGKALLGVICAQGATLVGKGPLIAHMIEDIQQTCAGARRVS